MFVLGNQDMWSRLSSAPGMTSVETPHDSDDATNENDVVVVAVVASAGGVDEQASKRRGVRGQDERFSVLFIFFIFFVVV
jgi:hypothetical protein